MIIGVTKRRNRVGQNPTKTKQMMLPSLQMKLLKQVLHRITKIKRAIAVERKDTSVLIVERRIQERKKEDWAFRKAEQHTQTQTQTTREDDDSIAENKSVQSNGPLGIDRNGLLMGINEINKKSLYNAHNLEVRLKNCITLNNGSTLSLFSNPDFVTNIRTTRTTLALAKNAGVKKSNQEAQVPGFGKVYYNKDAIANIFGFLDLKKKHRITYNSDN